MEPAGSGATWTGSPKGVFAGRKHHKPRQGVVANRLNLFRQGAVGFIDWLDGVQRSKSEIRIIQAACDANGSSKTVGETILSSDLAAGFRKKAI